MSLLFPENNVFHVGGEFLQDWPWDRKVISIIRGLTQLIDYSDQKEYIGIDLIFKFLSILFNFI